MVNHKLSIVSNIHDDLSVNPLRRLDGIGGFRRKNGHLVSSKVDKKVVEQGLLIWVIEMLGLVPQGFL